MYFKRLGGNHKHPRSRNCFCHKNLIQRGFAQQFVIIRPNPRDDKAITVVEVLLDDIQLRLHDQSTSTRVGNLQYRGKYAVSHVTPARGGGGG
jgi:hypothetical protein